jgi:High potential iron-sulfur protein
MFVFGDTRTESMLHKISRRALSQQFGHLMGGAAFGLLLLRSATAADKLCADPSTMDSGQQSLRASLNYSESSPDHSKTCSVCAFYQAADGTCGNCMIFSGPANKGGHCDSWSPKG